MNSQSSRYDKLESLLQSGSSEPHNLPLEYLRNITNNFSDERRLGEGGFGTVYKGVLQNGKAIAVKKLNSSIPGVQDSQFENEASHLMRLKHPNVVLLVGWCSETQYIPMEYNGTYVCAEKSERLLCLEYMPEGNLRGYLSDEFSGLGWDTRYKIIEGICYGLRYLHEQWQPNAPIVHMDLKPANILLDYNMVPKIADFGLSRLFSEEKTWTSTISRNGTLGYMSPEYINKGLISTKSDIFSLGVIIIEIVTGRRDYPDDTGTLSVEFIETVLHNWSQRKGINILFGASLETVNYQQIRRCIQIGLDCVKTDRSKRPTISQIIKALQRPESADSSNLKWVRSPGNMVSSYNLLDTGMNPIMVHGQSGKGRGVQSGWLGNQTPEPEVPGSSLGWRVRGNVSVVTGRSTPRKSGINWLPIKLPLMKPEGNPASALFHGQSGKRERNFGETSCMERLAKKHTTGFSIVLTQLLRQQTALRRIRVIFSTVVLAFWWRKQARPVFSNELRNDLEPESDEMLRLVPEL